MPRRVSLPAADELFRTTGGAGVQPSAPQEHPDSAEAEAAGPGPRVPPPAEEPRPEEGADRAAQERSAEPAEGQSAPAGRTTAPVPAQTQRRTGAAPSRGGTAGGQPAGAAGGQRRPRAPRRPSGRERHDEKITVYVSAEELMDLEHARLVLRGEHGLAVDRGRIVREAVAVVLADLESRGDASILVRRLRGR